MTNDETNSIKNFYFQSKFFEKEDEFRAYVKDFNNRQTTQEDFDSLFDIIKKDIWINLYIRKTKLNNSELRKVLEKYFFLILEDIWEKESNFNDN